jgi:hypothetical protein
MFQHPDPSGSQKRGQGTLSLQGGCLASRFANEYARLREMHQIETGQVLPVYIQNPPKYFSRIVKRLRAMFFDLSVSSYRKDRLSLAD